MPVACDCLNFCGDDPWLATLKAAKCPERLSREAARRADQWQRFEDWYDSLKGAGVVLDKPSARAAWHAARKLHTPR